MHQDTCNIRMKNTLALERVRFIEFGVTEY